jgi:putative transposase
MTYYRRNLPHWQPEYKDLFVTWRLYGSLPRGTERSLQAIPEKDSGKRFSALDTALDRASSGPIWLREAKVAEAVEITIRRGERDWRYYELHAYVIMANHVHLLIRPLAPLRQITFRVKGVSARAGNRILGNQGRHFWQDESFDHWIRNGAEFARAKRYIEYNPVSAHLSRTPQDWPWSSASRPALQPRYA